MLILPIIFANIIINYQKQLPIICMFNSVIQYLQQIIMITISRLLNRNLIKLVYKNLGSSQMSQYKLEGTRAKFTNIQNSSQYLFSTQKQPSKTQSKPDKTKSTKTAKTSDKQGAKKKKDTKKQKYQDQTIAPLQYYRNIVRRINIKQTGRGRFNPIKFLKLINLCKTPEHGKIIFQAYYNILGHFTILPNGIIDELIIKALTINADINSVIQVYKNHAYLGYFPHYKATNKALKTISEKHDENTFRTFLVTLTCSPLIKINHEIIYTLENIYAKESTSEVVRKNIVKFLIYRRRQVKQFVSNAELNQHISAMLQKIPLGPILAKSQIQEHIQNMLSQPNQSSEELINKCIIASAFNFVQNSGRALAESGQELSVQHQKYFNFLKSQYQLSDKSLNYAEVLQGCFSQTKVSIQNLKKIQQLKLIVGEQQAEVEAEEEQK